MGLTLASVFSFCWTCVWNGWIFSLTELFSLWSGFKRDDRLNACGFGAVWNGLMRMSRCFGLGRVLCALVCV